LLPQRPPRFGVESASLCDSPRKPWWRRFFEGDASEGGIVEAGARRRPEEKMATNDIMYLTCSKAHYLPSRLTIIPHTRVKKPTNHDDSKYATSYVEKRKERDDKIIHMKVERVVLREEKGRSGRSVHDARRKPSTEGKKKGQGGSRTGSHYDSDSEEEEEEEEEETRRDETRDENPPAEERSEDDAQKEEENARRKEGSLDDDERTNERTKDAGGGRTLQVLGRHRL